MTHNRHAIRAFLIILAVVSVGIIVRSSLIPDSWGHYGPYRAANLEEVRKQEMLVQDIDTCLDCHEKEWDMADGKHGAVPCEDCHHSETVHAVRNDNAPSSEDVAKTEAQATAQLSFQSILAVMKQGWDKKEIDRFLAMLNQGKMGIRVRLFRGPVVIKQFGQREGEAAAMDKSPDIKESLTGGQEKLAIDKDNVRYLYPLMTEKQCVECHSAATEGQPLGVLEVTFPVANLAMKRYTRLAAMTVDRSREACQMCHAKLNARPKSFPQVEDFDKHITKGWKTAMGPVDVKAPCMTCHNPHSPAMVKRKEE